MVQCVGAGALGLGAGALWGCNRNTGQASAGTAARNGGPTEVALDDDDILESWAQRPDLPVEEPVVRVRVMKIRNPTNDLGLRVGSHNQSLIVTRGGSEDRGLAFSGPMDVTFAGETVELVDSHGMRVPTAQGQWVQVACDGEAGRGSLEVARRQGPTWDGVWTYPGTIRIVPRPGIASGAVDVINHVFVEDYLPGVLAGELYRQWHLETFAAQAVAARSYAITEVAVFRDRRVFDMSATTTSQMYLGRVEHEKAQQAVRTTRGLLLAYEGAVISGYYSSCCGGKAATAEDAFGRNAVNAVAPLNGRDGPDVCTEAPVYAWTARRSATDVEKRLRAWGERSKRADLAGLGVVTEIGTARVNAHGRATVMAIHDDTGRVVELAAEDFRRACNYVPANRSDIGAPDPVLRSSQCTATVAHGAMTFTGNGFGHGAGLCQYGAQALAVAGRSHLEILQWYYPGAEIVPAYA